MDLLDDENISDFLEKENKYTRNRIVVLGRQGAGKTTFLSLLYSTLWSSKDGLKMETLEGSRHAEFLKTALKIKKGEKIEPTTDATQSTMELIYKSKKRTMVTLDYMGEVFTDAFIKDINSEPVLALLNHIDHAQAVILLVDPKQVLETDVDAHIDNTYGILQVVNRIHNWPGGDEIPIVIAFTKADENQDIFDSYGGRKNFMMKYFPDLVQKVRHLHVCKVSVKQPDGSDKIKTGYSSSSLVTPLIYCLDFIEKNEEALEKIKMDTRLQKFQQELIVTERNKALLLIMFFLVLWIALLYGIFRFFPEATWLNLKRNIFF